LYVGVGILHDPNLDPESGKIKVYNISNNKLIFSYETKLPGTVTSINSVNNNLIAGVYNTLYYFKVLENSLVLLDSSQKITYIYSIDVLDNLVGVADLVQTINVFEVIDDKLQLLYKNYTIKFATAIKFISHKLLIVAEASGNILVLEAMPNRLLQPVNGFNIGSEIINCIKKTNIGGLTSQSDSVIFTTSSGTIGAVIGITEANYKIFSALQDLISSKSLFESPNEFRKPKDIEISMPIFIQGDIIESYLDMSQESQATLAIQVSDKIGECITSEKLNSILFEMKRLH
jgi:CPSF A subunit region